MYLECTDALDNDISRYVGQLLGLYEKIIYFYYLSNVNN